MIAWRGAASARLVSSADRAYMKAPVPRPTPDFRTKSRTCGHTHEKADGFFSQNCNGREAILGLFRLDNRRARPGGADNGGALVRRSS